MSESQRVAQAICERLAPGGPLLLMGPPALLEQLADRVGRRGDLALLASPLHPRKLRRLGSGRQLVRCKADDLPAGDASFAGIALVGLLSTLDRAQAALRCWRRVLRPGGCLVLADRLSWSPAMRALTGREAPDHPTGLLLNAGFVAIRQSWTHGGTVITTAKPGPM